jgi:hypothetical protein
VERNAALSGYLNKYRPKERKKQRRDELSSIVLRRIRLYTH